MPWYIGLSDQYLGLTGPEVLSYQHNTFKIDKLININSMHTPLAGLWNQFEVVKNLQLLIILPNATLRAL